MEKNNKRLIILMGIIIVALIAALIVSIVISNTKKKQDLYGNMANLTDEQLEALKKLDPATLDLILYEYTDTNASFEGDEFAEVVNDEVESTDYLKAVYLLDKYTSAVNNARNDNGKRLLNLLSADYIEENELTSSNILSTFKNQIDFTLTSLKTYYGDEIVVFLCDGIWVNANDTNDVDNDYRIVLLIRESVEDDCFAVIPDDGATQFENWTVDQKPNFEVTLVERNDDNSVAEFYDSNYLEDSKLVQSYFNIYVKSALYDTEKAYELLDETYRNDEFGSVEKFKNYVKDNYNDFKNLRVTDYAKLQDGYVHEGTDIIRASNAVFSCTDSKNRNFNIAEAETLKFKIEY